MTPTRDLRRAAKAGRRDLGRALPPVLHAAFEAPSKQIQDEAFALSGSLAVISIALTNAYQTSGAHVRGVIWALHQFLREQIDPALPELQPYVPWLRTALTAENNETLPLRSIIFRWVDAASERLTMPRYIGAGHRRRQASVLIAAPCRWITRQAPKASGENDALDLFSELLLRFWDLLEAEKQISLGHNLIVPGDHDEIGGFYGLTGEALVPSTDETNQSLQSLSSDLESCRAPAENECFTFSPLLAAMRQSLHERIRSGQWPLGARSPHAGSRSGAFWLRLLTGKTKRL